VSGSSTCRVSGVRWPPAIFLKERRRAVSSSSTLARDPSYFSDFFDFGAPNSLRKQTGRILRLRDLAAAILIQPTKKPRLVGQVPIAAHFCRPVKAHKNNNSRFPRFANYLIQNLFSGRGRSLPPGFESLVFVGLGRSAHQFLHQKQQRQRRQKQPRRTTRKRS
jgi:hypothetical protein